MHLVSVMCLFMQGGCLRRPSLSSRTTYQLDATTTTTTTTRPTGRCSTWLRAPANSSRREDSALLEEYSTPPVPMITTRLEMVLRPVSPPQRPTTTLQCSTCSVKYWLPVCYLDWERFRCADKKCGLGETSYITGVWNYVWITQMYVIIRQIRD